VTIHAGTTEGECARSASSALSHDGAGYFLTLIATWQQLAYSETKPDQEQIDRLCRDWDAHFSPQAALAAEQPT
jgi:hypothetical protein